MQLCHIFREQVLVDSLYICKVADFGLSRAVATKAAAMSGGDGAYYRSHGGALPVRWTSPEAMATLKFTVASDVWSYGVVLLEIFTDGETPCAITKPAFTSVSVSFISTTRSPLPVQSDARAHTYACCTPYQSRGAGAVRGLSRYPGMDNSGVMAMLLGGYRAPRPPGCPADIYGVMLQCWNERPADRPGFALLRQALELIATMLDASAADRGTILPGKFNPAPLYNIGGDDVPTDRAVAREDTKAAHLFLRQASDCASTHFSVAEGKLEEEMVETDLELFPGADPKRMSPGHYESMDGDATYELRTGPQATANRRVSLYDVRRDSMFASADAAPTYTVRGGAQTGVIGAPLYTIYGDSSPLPSAVAARYDGLQPSQQGRNLLAAPATAGGAPNAYESRQAVQPGVRVSSI